MEFILLIQKEVSIDFLTFEVVDAQRIYQGKFPCSCEKLHFLSPYFLPRVRLRNGISHAVKYSSYAEEISLRKRDSLERRYNAQ